MRGQKHQLGSSLAVGLCLLLASALPTRALAQTDEIQVYDGGLAAPGVFNLTLHNNYTPNGAKTPAFPGAIISHGSLNGVPEWAYGVTPWFEAGLYLPLYSVPQHGGPQIDGLKLRALFAEPDAGKRNFFYGVNFEFSFNSKHWDTQTYTSEIRPIIGWRMGKWDLIINPILDNNWSGISHLDFAPSTRLAYNISDKWAVAAEENADLGEVSRFLPTRDQSHQLFGVIDYSGKPFDVEAGIGFGLTPASDKVTLKLILSRDLN